MKIDRRIAGILMLMTAWLLHPPMATAVTLGQMDDFQDGTAQHWIIGDAIGNPVPPVVVLDGGPAGPGDHYLLLTADGGAGGIGPDPGSRLVVINQTQWAGNYLAAGVNAITMWVNNLGATDLALRFYVADDTIRRPLNTAISTIPVLLPAGSGWTPVVFPIGLGYFTALSGNLGTALANAAELRIFHNPNRSFPGPAVVASLGVDNITAVRRRVPLPYLPLLLLDD